MSKDWGKNDEFFLSLIRNGTYIIGDDGRVFSMISGRYIGDGNGFNSSKRYIGIEARDDTGKIRYINKHRLISLAKTGLIPKGYTVNHEDGNKRNCRPSNLVVAPHRYNIQHSFRTGLQPKIPKGNLHWLMKVTDVEVAEIRIRYAAGDGTYRSLAQDYGVSYSLIAGIITQRRRV